MFSSKRARQRQNARDITRLLGVSPNDLLAAGTRLLPIKNSAPERFVIAPLPAKAREQIDRIFATVVRAEQGWLVARADVGGIEIYQLSTGSEKQDLALISSAGIILDWRIREDNDALTVWILNPLTAATDVQIKSFAAAAAAMVLEIDREAGEVLVRVPNDF